MPHIKSQIRHWLDLTATISFEKGSMYTLIALLSSEIVSILYKGKERPLYSEPDFFLVISMTAFGVK